MSLSGLLLDHNVGLPITSSVLIARSKPSLLKERILYEYVRTGIEELDEKIRGYCQGGLTFPYGSSR